MVKHQDAHLQKTPGQLIQVAGRFSLQVDDIPVNVEVVPHPVVSSVVSKIVSKVMAEQKDQKDPTKHPSQKQDKNDDNNDKSDSDCEMSKKDTEHLSKAVSHVKWMAHETAK